MITLQEETYNSLFEDKNFEKIIQENFKETGVLNSSFTLKPRLEMYKFLAEQKILLLYSVRDSKKLVGYFIAVMTDHPHYRKVKTVETDTFFLSKEYRKGLLGYKFLKYTIFELKKKVNLIFLTKVNLIFLTSNIKRDLSTILSRLGFKLTDYKYMLEV